MVTRMNRDEFLAKLDGMEAAEIKKALWTVYWRGTAPVRERIEELLEPQRKEEREKAAKLPPDAATVLAQVSEFASLARSGAYLGRDRRVPAKERSNWRFTFRRLADDAQKALRGRDVDTAATALATLIDVVCETRSYEYFRSEDPIEAARFVTSDAAATIWARWRDEYGANHVATHAPAQLVGWESRYGWTRFGFGWVSEHETSLASRLAGFLVVPDLWTTATLSYLDVLDEVAQGNSGHRNRAWEAEQLALDLAEWNALLVERLVGSEQEGLLDRLVAHPALAGAELTFVEAQLERRRGDLAKAASLVGRCLNSMPGHPEFRAFAEDVNQLTDPTMAGGGAED